MNKTIIFRKIGGIISEITEQYQYLAENPENISPLEMELFIANSHFLTEHLTILSKITEQPLLLSENNAVISLDEKKDSGRITILPESAQPEKEEIKPDSYNPISVIENEEIEADNWFKPVQSETNNPNHKPEIVEFIFQNEDAKTQVEIDGNDENLSQQSEKTPADSLSTESIEMDSPEINSLKVERTQAIKPQSDEKPQTLNDVLSAGMSKENIAFKMNRQENKDLKSMIKLNEKLMFVRDLFNGYSLAYSEAIELVNRFDNFELAENFLKQNYAVKNKWSEKQSTVDQFYEVLNRRFS
jgi:hypothetical protein